jgi:hypothetical protein
MISLFGPTKGRWNAAGSGNSGFGFATTARVFAHTAFLKNHFQRAEIRKGRLYKVEPYECSEPEPILAVIMREQQAQENKRASKPPDDHMHFHNSTSTEPGTREKSQPKSIHPILA